MCVPGASSAIDGLSAYSSASAQKKGLRAESAIARQNAGIEEQRGRNSIELGRQQIEQLQQQGAQLESTQKNTMADNGIDVSTGSAIDILAGTRQLTNADVDTMRYNAALESWGHQVNATNYTNQANMAYAQSKNISPMRSGLMTLTKSFIGEAQQAGGLKTLLGG